MNEPKFYEVDGELVVISEEDGGTFGRSVPLGKPYPPYKAINEGEEITRVEFLEKLKELYPDSKLSSLF